MLDNLNKYDIVLASNSPRRKQLLAELGLHFRVEVLPDIDETFPPDLPARDSAEYIARKKAAAYALTPQELLITADTIVLAENHVLGKPADEREAHQMLKALSGKTHSVITGVTVTTLQSGTLSFSTETAVTFDHLTDDEINYYVHRYHPLDKAGAYGIQEWIGYIGVRSIEGSFYNVMGLPVQRLYRVLKTL